MYVEKKGIQVEPATCKYLISVYLSPLSLFCRLHDTREQGVGIRHQSLGGVEFGGSTLIHDQDVITLLQDLVVETVHDGKDGSSGTVGTHGFLQEDIGTGVDGSGGLIQQQDLGVAEDSAGQAQELTLANGVVGAVVSNDGVELILLVRNKFLETNQFESVPERGIVIAALEV